MYFPWLGGLNVGDGTCREVDVEPKQVKVIHGF